MCAGVYGTKDKKMNVEEIIGGLYIDQRGIVSYVNEFDFKGVERFYTIRAHGQNETRGWIGHREEDKWFTPLQGTILIAVVVPDEWDDPSPGLEVKRYVLSHLKPTILHVPPGHVTASVMLTSDSLLGVFSSGKIEDAANDNWRFDIEKWNVKN
jgi:dTDP-4-dehydrorhamnose 3,5-epimerase